MKRFSRVLLVAVALMSALPLAGCEQTEIEKAVDSAYKYTESLKSYDMLMDMQMEMSVEGQDVSVGMQMKMTCFAEDQKIKADMKVEMAGVSEEMLMYAEQVGEGYCTYLQQDGKWIKMTIPNIDDLKSSINGQDLNKKLVLDNAESFKQAGRERVKDMNTYVLKGKVSGKSLLDIITAVYAGDVAYQTAFSEYFALFEEAGDMDVTVWVDEKTYFPVQYTIDMTDMINTMVGTQDAVKKCVMTIGYANLDSAEDFDIPKEAKNAEELNLETSGQSSGQAA